MHSRSQSMPPDSIKTVRKFIKYPVMLFGFLVIIFGLVPFFIYFNASRVSGGEVDWLPAEAEVTAAEVKASVHTSSVYDKIKRRNVTRTTTDYLPEITYSYSVAEKKFTGSKFRTLGFSSKREHEIKELVAKYPVGSKITVFYNPEKKEEAVIEKAPAPSKIILVFGGVVVIVGFLIVLVLSTIVEKMFDMVVSQNSNVRRE